MGVHIDDELLARLIGPGLSERERRPVLAHLESCDACRRSAADAMQLADETRTLAGRYRLEGELGRGGMGMVFRARDDVLERIVAIKLLPPGTTAEPRARARLVRESKAMARLRHPNVVAVYDAGYDGDQFFVAMEHVPGATLRTWLSTRKRTQPEIVAMLAKAARGLAAAHAVGVIHRDFKPDNVLVDEHGEPRVADFGLARTDETVDFDEYERDEVSIADGLTATGQELGTPAYMAPEQYGGEIDRRVDVFAFCVVLHEALFGVRPFTEVSIEARLGAIARGERVAVRRIDRRLQRVLDRGLAADPARRFATMEDVVAALERSGGQRGRWVVAAGLVGTLALGGAALWSTRAEPCAAPDDRLRAAWSSAAIPRIEQAHFDALPHLEAQMTWSRLRPSIDGVVAALDQEELLLCEAQRKGELDDELAWRRGACLRHERGAIAYRLELAAEGDVAASRGLDLGEPAPWCRALAQELRGDAPESANAAAHAEVERGLAEIAALNRMGRDDALLAHAPAVIAAAEQIGEPLLAARARFELGRQTPDDDQASATLEQAAHAAAAEGEHVTAAKAWVYSGYYATDDRRRFLDAAHVELAQVVEPQVRDRVLVQAELLEAQILDDEGDREAARACLERAIVLARAEAPAAVPDILFMSTWLAWADGELALALATQRELVRWHDDAFTPNRQAHSRALWDLADLEVAAADFDAALATITRAREVGDAHDARVETARWLMSEAEIRMHRGELARMDELFVQIDALRTGDDVQLHEKVRALKGVAALAHGDTRSAAELVAIALANGDPRPDFAIDAADALAARAEALRRDGDADTAARELAPVLAKFREQHPRLPERGRLALASAWVLHDLARDREAIAHFDEALVTLVDPSERAWAELGRRVAEGGAIEPELGDRVHTALARWPGSHRYELDVLARLR